MEEEEYGSPPSSPFLHELGDFSGDEDEDLLDIFGSTTDNVPPTSSFDNNDVISSAPPRKKTRGEFVIAGDRNEQLPVGKNTNLPVEDDEPQKAIWGTTVNVEQTQQTFEHFFRNFREEEDSEPLYPQLLAKAIDTENPNVNIDCHHLHSFDPELYKKLVLYPQEVIPIFDIVIQKFVAKIKEERGEELNPDDFTLQQPPPMVQVRTFNLMEKKSMRDLNPQDINKLVSIKGMVTRTSSIMPDIKEAFFRCTLCKDTQEVQIDRGRINEPSTCNYCKARQTMEMIHNRCIFADKQITKVQETPDSIPEGETPYTVNVYTYDALVDVVKPGDRIEITGIYRANTVRMNPRQRVSKAIFRTYIDAIHFRKEERETLKTGDGNDEEDDEYRVDFDQSTLVDEQAQEKRRKILELSKRSDIYELLARSLAPNIFELDDVKKGLLCQLFGGTNKKFKGSAAPRCRGEINVLLCGDPGTSKSQLLTYVHKIAPRGIYTSGKGSSAVGLTAYISKDPDTRQTVLESGALVLSDRGVCCIDEFDKMSDQTRSILHEAMEQQTVSVAKAGIICTLNARTSVLASANPQESRYNPRLSVVANIQLPPTLLSRFDLIFLVLDKPNIHTDARLARHIVSLYTGQTTNRVGQDLIDRETLSEYIAYARAHVHPVISDEAAAVMAETYKAMRRSEGNRKTITATTRQLESLIRLSEALAKMRLSEIVEAKDVEEAARLIRVALQQAATDPRTGTIDMDLITTGRSAAAREKLDDLRKEVHTMLQSQGKKRYTFANIVEAMRNQSSVDVPHSELREVLERLVAEGLLRPLPGEHAYAML